MQSLNNTPFLFSELICSDSFQFNNSVKTQQIILQQYWTSFYALGLTRNMQFKFRRNDFNINSLQKKKKKKKSFPNPVVCNKCCRVFHRVAISSPTIYFKLKKQIKSRGILSLNISEFLIFRVFLHLLDRYRNSAQKNRKLSEVKRWVRKLWCSYSRKEKIRGSLW